MIESKHVGNLGEEIASLFLMKHGYKIIERNYLRKWGELDIISVYNKIIVFVEVKTVSCESIENVIHETNKDVYRPEDNVHKAKQDRLKRAIQTYLVENKLGDREWSFSVITIFLDQKNKKAKIELIDDLIL
jgi:putative endonuclease